MNALPGSLNDNPRLDLWVSFPETGKVVVNTGRVELGQGVLTAMAQVAADELDVALSRVVVDFSGRPGLEYHIDFPRARIGDFDVDLFREFFQGFVNHALVTLHIDNLRGRNAHHIVETVFKAFGRAVRMALEHDPRMQGIMPSTKGSL